MHRHKSTQEASVGTAKPAIACHEPFTPGSRISRQSPTESASAGKFRESFRKTRVSVSHTTKNKTWPPFSETHLHIHAHVFIRPFRFFLFTCSTPLTRLAGSHQRNQQKPPWEQRALQPSTPSSRLQPHSRSSRQGKSLASTYPISR